MIDDDEDYISKSQIKRECHALTDLGVELAALTDEQLNTVPMSDSLLNAINEYKRIRKHSALKRQRLYIGKLIRNDDWESIQQHLDKIKEASQQSNAEFKAMERWRDRMLSDGDDAINAFIGEHHDADRQKIRQLVKNAVKEKQQEKAPANARKLFKYIREIMEIESDSL